MPLLFDEFLNKNHKNKKLKIKEKFVKFVIKTRIFAKNPKKILHFYLMIFFAKKKEKSSNYHSKTGISGIPQKISKYLSRNKKTVLCIHFMVF